MKKAKAIVKIKISSDSSDCECCGYSYAEACKVSVEDWSFGCEAFSHCFGRYEISNKKCFIALFKKLSIKYDFHKYEDIDLDEMISLLEKSGYEVEFDDSCFEIYDYDIDE